jgi:DNA-directed RNA polymerase specialized sigma24 family protein
MHGLFCCLLIYNLDRSLVLMTIANTPDDFIALVEYLLETDLVEYSFHLLETPRDCRTRQLRGHILGGVMYSRADAEDLANCTVRQAFQRREEFDRGLGPEGLRTWLRQLCREEASKTSFTTYDDSFVFANSSKDYTFQDRLQHDDLLEKAVKHFHTRATALTPQQEECFIDDIRGETQVQTAHRLGITPQTVNQHLLAAKQKMRAKEMPTVRKSARRTPHKRTLAEARRSRFVADLLLRNLVDIEAEEIVIDSIIGVSLDGIYSAD